MQTYKRFKIEQSGDVTELFLSDTELTDFMIQTELSNELREFVETKHPMKLMVNFASVTQCTSGGVNGLLSIRKLVDNYSGQLKLCEMSKNVRETYRLLRFDGKLFDIYEKRTDALDTF